MAACSGQLLLDNRMRDRYNDKAPAPNLYLSPAEWRTLQDTLADPFFAELHHRARRIVDELIRSHGQAATERFNHRACKAAIQHCAVVWHIDRDTRCRDLALALLEQTCALPWTPTHSNGIRKADLRTGELMYVVAFAFDAFYDELSGQQRRICVKALIENGLERYFAGIEARDWWYNCDFNWNSALHGNAGVAALAIREHAPDIAARALDEARKGLAYMTAAYFPGGGWTEGLMYFGTATCHLTDFAFALERNTGDDLGVLSDRNLHDAIDWALTMHGGDGRPYNFSDMHAQKYRWSAPHIFWYADACNRPDWTANQDTAILGRTGERESTRGMVRLFSDIDAFWYRRPFQQSEPRDIRGLHHFRGIDWVAWRGTRSWLAFRGGCNGGNHNNHDLGHCIFGLDRTRFLDDPGYGAIAADMHNCPTIRLKDQTDGATARVLRCDELRGGFSLVCDIQEAFPHVLLHYDRHLVLLDDTHLVIVDDIKGRGSHRNDARYHLQTARPARTTDEGFAIDGDECTLRVVLGAETGKAAVEPYEHRGRPLNRLLWYDEYYRVHSVHPVVFTPSDEEVTVSVEGSRVDIAIGGVRCRLVMRGGWGDTVSPARRWDAS
ncbi:MAG: hypothetical protein GF331_08275 [Chitinivibrionales bacterium]|nr:hypothetical protein [Chitinivibrionales bacterium]